MTKTITLLITLMSFAVTLQANNCLLMPKTIDNRIEDNSIIVEGQVIDQESYWDADHLRIYTSNTVLIYKVFQGEINAEEIVVITEGGIVDDEMHIASPSLNLEKGNFGLFFLNNTTTQKKNTSISIESGLQFFPTENAQAFIEYDLFQGTAKGVYEQYEDIGLELYENIEAKTQKSYTEFNALNSIQKKNKNKNEEFANKSVNLVPFIDCMYPDIVSGGTNSLFTIYGEDFGEWDNGINCRIEFKNPDDGGATYKKVPKEHIVSWDNNQIELIVPAKAGSGNVTVRTSSGITTISSNEIKIPFAVANVGSNLGPTHLINENGLGGYSLKYCTSTSSGGMSFANSLGVAPFERALNNLQETLGFNIFLQGTSNVNVVGNDGENVVMFDNNSNPLAAAGLMYSQYTNCGTGWELAGMDVVFRRPNTGTPNLNWNFSSSPPAWDQIDFESVAIHELMHGMQLRHVVEEDAVMYFAYAFGVMRRNIGMCYDYQGGLFVTEASENHNAVCSGHEEYTTHAQHDPPSGNFTCAQPTVCSQNPEGAQGVGITVNANLFLEGFYNGGSTMSNNLYLNNLLPIEHPFRGMPWQYNGAEGVSKREDIPSDAVDWVLIALHRSDFTLVEKKAVFLGQDGYLTDLEGNKGIFFPGVEPGNYHILIHHCNHVSVVSSQTISYPTEDVYDFTTGIGKAMGNAQLKYVKGKYALFSGDYDGNGVINNHDYNKWGADNALVSVYVAQDGDGSGVVNNLDYNLWTENRSKVGVSLVQF